MSKTKITNLKTIEEKRNSYKRKIVPYPKNSILACGLTPQAIKVFELGLQQIKLQAKVD